MLKPSIYIVVFLLTCGAVWALLSEPKETTEYQFLPEDNHSAMIDTKPSSPPVNEALANINKNLKTMSEQLAGLNSRVDQLEKLTEQDLTSLPTNLTANEKHGLSGKPKDPLTQEELEQRRQEFNSSLEQEFQSEEVDEDWSLSAQNQIDNLFINSSSETYQKTQLASAECRSTSCRISVSHAEDLDPEEFEIEFFRVMAEMGMGRIRGYTEEVNGVKRNNFFATPTSGNSEQ